MALNQVNVSDGQWHTIFVERIGKMAVLKLDSGEGRYYNMSRGSLTAHLQILVARRQFYAGGDVKFPSSRDPAIVDYDFRDSKSLQIFFLKEKKKVYIVVISFVIL